ncbi:nitroreductase family protein [Methanothermobacter sp.]|uniref:nitroreductase family protein n=1 Tax=Methanothermobacter sp. TaxID=1884223 RepID=UPI002619F481|nr:nitroreductase family protein [Methanothermobacter sp.]MDI9614322.1 nitroreductase family protein [Methanothermobacter sp.]
MKKLYPFIFRRKSTRRYSSPVSDDALHEIRDYLGGLESLLPSIPFEFRIIGENDVSTRMQKPAPHYIAAFSEGHMGRLNVGFMLQQMDLKLSSMGIGSCWQGIPRVKGHVKSDLEFIILLAFGVAAEPVHREPSEFKRKPLCEITDIRGMDDVLEAVRLAPSAVNNQPWYLRGGDGIVHAYCRVQNPVKRRLLGRWNPIDMGIALAHLKISLEHHGYGAEFRILDKTPEIKNYTYKGTYIYGD